MFWPDGLTVPGSLCNRGERIETAGAPSGNLIDFSWFFTLWIRRISFPLRNEMIGLIIELSRHTGFLSPLLEIEEDMDGT